MNGSTFSFIHSEDFVKGHTKTSAVTLKVVKDILLWFLGYGPITDVRFWSSDWEIVWNVVFGQDDKEDVCCASLTLTRMHNIWHAFS